MFSHFVRKVSSIGWGSSISGATIVRAGGWKWHLTSEAIEILGPGGPNLDGWIADGSAVLVKTGPHRTVYRVELPTGTVYVKHCRIMGPRAWAREMVRPAKARLEFENALVLAGRGVPVVMPLAWGATDSAWPGESVLITRSRDRSTTFLDLVENRLPTLGRDQTSVRRRLATELGRFFAKLHDAGVAHPDPHPGNLLVEFSPADLPRFCLIDVHATHIGRPLTWSESRANLVLFNRWFQIRVSRADRARFWHSYGSSRTTLPNLTAIQPREVESRTVDSNLRFWAGRQSRCLGCNRYFRKLRAGTIRGYAVSDLPDEIATRLLVAPESLCPLPGSRVLKDSRTSTVVEFEVQTPGGPREVVLKRVNIRNSLEPLKNRFRPSAVLRSWVNGQALRDRWLPTPRPLAAVHVQRVGLPAEGYLLVEKVPNALGLTEALASISNRPAPARSALLRVWMSRLGRMIRHMHDRAVSHRDLKASNILLEGLADNPDAAIPVLIDLVGVRIGRTVSFRQRSRELARLNASFLTSPIVTRSERLRFLLIYLAAGERLEANWKDWWRAIKKATEAKVSKNLRSGRPLA